MEILLTGARGFIGSHLVEQLSAQHEVTAVHRGGGGSALSEKVRWVEHLLEREWDFDCNADVLVYAATQHRMSRTPATVRNYVNSNILGLLNAAEYAVRTGVRRFIYFSTVTVHGEIESGTVNERSPLNAPNLYGTSKYAGESILLEFVDIPATVVRLPGVVGPGSGWERPWLATVLKRALDGEPITYRNPDALFNNVTDLDEVSRFLGHLLASPAPSGFDTVYLAARDPIPVREVVETLVAEADSESTVEAVAAVDNPFSIDISHLTGKYGFTPSRTVDILRAFVRNGLSPAGTLV